MTADEAGVGALAEQNSADIEKGSKELQQQPRREEEEQQQRDQDGVLLEDGIPIVRLAGAQDPYR